jgi:predicted lipoprotein with Yx(FWY)xxD motif
MYYLMRGICKTGLIIYISALVGCAGYSTSSEAAQAKFAGGVLVNSDGMTLYTFDKDSPGAGKSMCSGPCADNWPPLHVAAGTQVSQPYSVISRDDGSSQLAYQGKPLYLWIKDKKPGEMTGDNFKQVWHVVRQMDAAPPVRRGYGY